MSSMNLSSGMNVYINFSEAKNGSMTLKEFVPWMDVCLNLAFFILGSLGNGLVIYVLGFRMKKSGFLTYVLNLAVADFGFCALLLLQIPVNLAKYHYMYSLAVCKMEQYLTRVFFYAGSLFIAAICLERCLAILHPIWHKCKRPARTTPLACTLIWALSCFIALPNLIKSDIISFGKRGDRCFVNDINTVILISTSELVLIFLLPLAVILTCSAVIINKLRKRGKGQSQVNRTVCLVAFLFLLCWTPFQIGQYMHLIQMFFLKDNLQFRSVASTMGYYCGFLLYLNSCLNPAIYVLMGRDIKQRVVNSLSSLMAIFEKAFSESENSTMLSSLKTSSSTVH
ncbi:C3a anaphylatoxin chemotactic receptor-like [Erpetoichthys calabaricus]|uniref:C3a anaphylatoxin chemotactic receptor-like n=1 Tax=Erpetoichthys calabaricus TaxID=27687 RepID=UPI0010A07684|nr:C3a anaphylatoxin chemotactic receptor-like [Erpetoichthys calabaricus]